MLQIYHDPQRERLSLSLSLSFSPSLYVSVYLFLSRHAKTKLLKTLSTKPLAI